jgi:Zn-finger nucleic acid-binding protein
MQPGDKVRCACGRAILVPLESAHVARVLHCSSCGGDVGENATKCSYCGSALRYDQRGPACPECFASLSFNAQFCSECGIEIKPELLRTTPVDARCPRCRGPLVVRDIEGTILTDCTQCGGLWLDARAFEALVQKKDTKRLGSVAAAPVSHPPLAHQTSQYIPCVVCQSLMERKNFAGCSGVIIDWCRGHGFWFDAHELEAIVRFIEEGGLDKARQSTFAQRSAPAPRVTVRGHAAPPPSMSGYTDPGPSGANWANLILWTLTDLFF